MKKVKLGLALAAAMALPLTASAADTTYRVIGSDSRDITTSGSYNANGTYDNASSRITAPSGIEFVRLRHFDGNGCLKNESNEPSHYINNGNWLGELGQDSSPAGCGDDSADRTIILKVGRELKVAKQINLKIRISDGSNDSNGNIKLQGYKADGTLAWNENCSQKSSPSTSGKCYWKTNSDYMQFDLTNAGYDMQSIQEIRVSGNGGFLANSPYHVQVEAIRLCASTNENGTGGTLSEIEDNGAITRASASSHTCQHVSNESTDNI